MSSDPDTQLVCDRLGALGWTITRVTQPSLSIEGNDKRVASIWITRGALQGLFVVVFDCVDGDDLDKYAALGSFGGPPSGSIVSRRLPGSNWLIRAQVSDRAMVRTELECLRDFGARFGDEEFQRTLTLFEKRGWQIDREKSIETFFDEPGWSIVGTRDGDDLRLNALFQRPYGGEMLEVGDNGTGRLALKNASVFATLHSFNHAKALVFAF